MDSWINEVLPRVEDTFDHYKSMMMVLVFQMPTIVYCLAKVRLVTARFLWRNIKYAILSIFILAAVLTTSPHAWNQTVVAAPMVAPYLLSIVIIAWVSGRAASGNQRRNQRTIWASCGSSSPPRW